MTLAQLRDNRTKQARARPAFRRRLMQSNPKPYISPRELAAALGLAKPTVIHWLNRGWIIHSVLPNGRRLIPLSELERLLPKAVQKQDTATTGEAQ
jgi:hypothetical protein